jgi:hypothetical protein
MPSATFQQSINVTTAPQFVAWYQALHDQILAMGWEQTEDTGQLDFSTFATVPSHDMRGAFLLYRMTDALAEEFPVVLRIECSAYSFSGTMAPNLRMRVSLGGSNGAGELLEPSNLIVNPMWPGGASSSNHYSFISGDTDRLAMALTSATLAEAQTTGHMLFGVERSRDNQGNPTGEFVSVIMGSPGGNWQFTIHRQMGQQPVDNHWSVAKPYAAGVTHAFGHGAGAAPVFPWLGGLQPPLTIFAAGQYSDFPHLQNILVNAYGEEIPYKAIRGNTSNLNLGTLHGINVYSTALMRFN